MLTSQLLVGGQVIEETPQFRSALETKQRIIREEYEGKLQEIEKERQMIEADKAQVDRYKQLLLKQRDIMLALTARINERDDTIIQLQEELDAMERINKRHEYNLNLKTNRIYKLKKVLHERGITSEELELDSDDLYSQSEPRFLNYPESFPHSHIFGDDNDHEMMKHVTGDEIIEELQGIINVSNKITRKHIPNEKENLDSYSRVRQLEGRLTEVVKENEALIDELQDKKFEVFKLRSKDDSKKELLGSLESALEGKI
mmetsp:Transcript_41230/g.47486  ORF Transcript_41230/g.47486 Transcript_41230/m.47486 type:complete len:259 (+) Transcript_41230:1566-2342(+)